MSRRQIVFQLEQVGLPYFRCVVQHIVETIDPLLYAKYINACSLFVLTKYLFYRCQFMQIYDSIRVLMEL